MTRRYILQTVSPGARKLSCRLPDIDVTLNYENNYNEFSYRLDFSSPLNHLMSENAYHRVNEEGLKRRIRYMENMGAYINNQFR